MKALVERVGRTLPLAVEHVDISDDPELEDRFGDEVPVLVVDGRKAATYRVTEDELRRLVLGRARATWP
jgi:hypothetical protein